MEQYLTERSRLFNKGSIFSCPDSWEQYGCKEPALHISISLVDLVGMSLSSARKAVELFEKVIKIGFDPLRTDQITKSPERFTFGIVYQFEGNRLLPIRFCE